VTRSTRSTTTRVASAVFSTTCLVACNPGDDPTESRGEAVLTSARGQYYQVDTSPAPSFRAAQRAEGTLFSPLTDSPTGKQTYAADGTALRMSCGITFISAHYGVTAGHCVGGSNHNLSSTLTVQMYRLDGLSSATVEDMISTASELWGAFPYYFHQNMDSVAANAPSPYSSNIDQYLCSVEVACGMSSYQCPWTLPQPDVALVYCPGGPGATYGYLNVAGADIPTAEVMMPWSHEIYDVSNTSASNYQDLLTHYVGLSTDDQNFHYFGKNTYGNERNQLLPLVSTRWPNGTPRTKLPAAQQGTAFETWTDLLGCHGTSGSGVLQQNPYNHNWELLGPAAQGGWTGLCADPTQFLVPGVRGISYLNVDVTQTLANLHPVLSDRVAYPTVGGNPSLN
jgi:hypothetical protein